MKKTNSVSATVSLVSELAAPIVKSLSLVLWDVLFEKEGSSWTLKIIIDKENDAISLDDCEAVSRALDTVLDEKDPIEQSYCLEVSSAGIERSLAREWHFLKYIGEKVSLRLIRPKDGERDFLGILTGFKDDTVIIEVNETPLSFSLVDIAFVRLYAEF